MKRYLHSLLVGLIAGVFYLFTLAEVHVGDTPFYVEGALNLELSPTHLMSRPLAWLLYQLGAAVVPTLSPYTGTAAIGALGGALAVAICHQLVFTLTRSSAAALFAAACAMFSYGVWRQAMTFEMHLLPAALTLGATWAMVRQVQAPDTSRWLVAAGLFQGLAACFHMIAGPVLIVWGVVCLALPATPAKRIERAALYSISALGIAQLCWLVVRTTGRGHVEATVVQAWLHTMGLVEHGSGQLQQSLFTTVTTVWARSLLTPGSSAWVGVATVIGLALEATVVLGGLWLLTRSQTRTAWPVLLAGAAWFPLTLYVEPQNMEYYTLLTLLSVSVLAVVFHQLIELAPAPSRLPLWAAAALLVVLQGTQHFQALAPYRQSPVEVPVGVQVSGPGQATLLDGWGHSRPWYGTLPVH